LIKISNKMSRRLTNEHETACPLHTWIVFKLLPHTQQTDKEHAAVSVVEQLREEIEIGHKSWGEGRR
jgi:hypothetical protein